MKLNISETITKKKNKFRIMILEIKNFNAWKVEGCPGLTKHAEKEIARCRDVSVEVSRRAAHVEHGSRLSPRTEFRL